MTKIIVFEGIDGTGKTVQLQRLYERLVASGRFRVRTLSFPMYDTFFGAECGRLLSGSGGVRANEVDGKSMALWYALDRFEAFRDLDYSDADVLLHAITDALFGAAALGDIGRHFSDTDPQFKGADSAVLLAEAYSRARDNGVDWRALYAVMEAGAARSGTLEKMVKPALDGDFDGSQFSLRNALKDLSYYCRLAAASERGASPLAEGIRNVFADAVAADLGDRYVSALLDPDLKHQEENR